MLERLQRIILKHTNRKDIELTENTVLLADTGMTSFDLVQMVCEVEEEFDVEIPDKALKSFKTIGDVIRFIKNNQ